MTDRPFRDDVPRLPPPGVVRPVAVPVPPPAAVPAVRAPTAEIRRSRVPLLLSLVMTAFGVATIMFASEVDLSFWYIVGIGVVFVWMGVGSAAAVLGDRIWFEPDRFVARTFTWFRFRTACVEAGDGCSMRVTRVRTQGVPGGIRTLEVRGPDGRRRLRTSLQWYSRLDRQRIVRRCERLCR